MWRHAALQHGGFYSNGNQYSFMQASFYIIVRNGFSMNSSIRGSSAWWSHTRMVRMTALDIQVSLRNPTPCWRAAWRQCTHSIFYHKINWNIYHENYQKLLRIWFFKDFQGAEFLGLNHFQEGALSKNLNFFQNFHLGRKLSPSLTKSRACFEILNIWQESQFIWLTFTIKTSRQNLVVKI